MIMRIITTPYGLVAWAVSIWIFLVFNIFLRIYFLWVRITTWFLNCVLSLILVWWFGLTDFSITIGEFGFLSVKDVKVRWKGDDPGLTIEEVGLKKLDWNFEKLRELTFLFKIRNVRRELFNDLKDATTEVFTSFTLHWKMLSPGELLSSDLHNSSETIPVPFTLLQATDVVLGSQIHVQRGASYVALFEAAVIDGLLVPSDKATSLCVKVRDMTYCCGPYDPGLNQAKREKIIKLSLVDFLLTSYSEGPTQISMSHHRVKMFVCPSKVNSSLHFLTHLLSQLLKATDSQSETRLSEREKSNMEKSLELNVRSDNSKASVCFQDGAEAISIIASFNLTFHKRNTKSQYTASMGIQSFVPSRQHTRDPCVIIGNELISAPWECSIAGSNWAGHSMVARVTSEQSFSLVLRPECIPVFRELHEDFSSILDLTQVNILLSRLKKKDEEPQLAKEIFIDFRGIGVCLEMDVYEELLNVSLEDIKAEFNRDQHHVTMELNVQELEVEDCTNKIIAFQQQRFGDVSSQFLLRFSLVQDAVSEEDRVVIKRLHTELGDSTVKVQETLLLKLLQFAGIKDKSQSTTEEQESSGNNLPAFLTTTRYYFEKLQVDPFQVSVTCNPASKLPDELQSLKTSLEIPAGFPPLMENATVVFGEFLRTGISYKTLVSLGRDARRHYVKHTERTMPRSCNEDLRFREMWMKEFLGCSIVLAAAAVHMSPKAIQYCVLKCLSTEEEIGRQSTSLLGSLHLLGNLSSLQGEIADGLADLKETGDYMGFVRHVRGGLAESYYKFADSWSATITQSAGRPDSGVSSTDSSPASDRASTMKSVRDVVGSLTSFILSPSKDTARGKLQLSSSPAASPPGSPSTQLSSRRLVPTESEDHDSSGSEESSLSCIQSVDDWEVVPRDAHRTRKGQEFLQRLQVSLCGETNEDEKFISCLKLRHLDPDDKLNALVTSQNVYFMKVGSPSADHVVLNIKLVNLYKARHRDQDGEHYLELLMKISGGKRLSLPSPNPADSPLVRCSTVKVAQRAANVINETKRKNEESYSR